MVPELSEFRGIYRPIGRYGSRTDTRLGISRSPASRFESHTNDSNGLILRASESTIVASGQLEQAYFLGLLSGLSTQLIMVLWGF